MAWSKRDKQIVAVVAVMTLALGGFMTFWMYRFVQEVQAARAKPVVQPPGKEAFEAANRTLYVASRTSVGNGNSAEASALAEEYSNLHELIDDAAFEGGRQTMLDELSTRGKFQTYCRLNREACVFLVHVPEMRNYTSDARATLRELAWKAAQSLVRERAPDRTQIVVALRGAMLYESIQIGSATGDPVVYESATSELPRLYPYFIR